jgi:hypothetical protein
MALKPNRTGQGVGEQGQFGSTPSEKIKQELVSWKGVTIHEHDFVTMMFYLYTLLILSLLIKSNSPLTI